LLADQLKTHRKAVSKKITLMKMRLSVVIGCTFKNTWQWRCSESRARELAQKHRFL